MKKQKFNKKLSLNKETISNLDKIKGGSKIGKDLTATYEHTCECPTGSNIPRECCW